MASQSPSASRGRSTFPARRSRFLAALGLLAGCLGLVAPANAADLRQPPVSAALPNLDQRAAAPKLDLNTLPAERQAGWRDLRRKVPGVEVELDGISGAPRWMVRTEGFLSSPEEPAGSTVQKAALPATPRDPHAPIKGFLNEHARFFGHGAEVLQSARVLRDYVTPHNGARTVVWQQELDGIEVFGGVLQGHLTRKGELINLASQFLPTPGAAADRGATDRHALQKTPAITATEAIARAAANVSSEVQPGTITALGPDPQGPNKLRHYQAAPLRGETRTRLVWLPLDRSRMRLCWQVELVTQPKGEWYRILVDAERGEVLIRQALTFYLTEASYRVFTSDSPTPFSPGYSTPSSGQPPVVPRELITLTALSTNASPNGWIDDGVNELRGNNVDAHLDRNDDDTPDLPRPQGSPFRVFDFPMDLSQSPRTYGSAAVTQLFYWNNWMHDELYELGFTEAAGNFQRLNFDRGGFGNDAVQADAQDGGGFNNANFSASSDGVPGRMQMYLFDGPTPDRDGTFDAEVVLHEYTHGLSTRLVGGGVGINALQSAGMGEGWSDFYAITLLSSEGDNLDGNYAAGAYASYQLGELEQNYYFGIRRYPYTTDLAKNPLTFKDIDPTQADRHTGVPLNPIFGGGGAPQEVHNQGEVWCVTLWQARVNLIRKWGFTVGNRLILQLVTDGMKLAPADPNFLEARDAILQADLVNNGGANREELWAAFARRGLGFSAFSPASSTTTGIEEAFDVPDDLRLTPRNGFVTGGPEGGPFEPLSQEYPLINVGTNTTPWSALKHADWLEVSPAEGALAPNGGATNLIVRPGLVAQSLPAGLYEDTITLTNHLTGRTQARTVLLRIGQPDFLTAIFKKGDNDLAHQTFTFTPNGSRDFYAVCREGAVAFPSDPAHDTVLRLGDDENVKLDLSGDAAVSLFGVTYRSLYLSANGYVTFENGVLDFSESLAAHFSAPRVSMLFEDFNPEEGGIVSWAQRPDRVVLTFEGVPRYRDIRVHSFQLELFFNGTLRLTYLDLESGGGLAGLSRGGGVPVGFVNSRFSTFQGCLPSLTVQLPSTASETESGLAGTVSIPGPLSADLVVTLESSDPSEVQTPASVTIAKGETSASFPLTFPDDHLLDGTRTARIRASAEGLRPGSSHMFVQDKESAILSLTLPPTAKEGDGLLSQRGTVTVDRPSSEPLLISLAADPGDEVEIPPVVIIAAGQTQAFFDLKVVDDRRIDGTISTRITAQVANWVPASASIAIQDNEVSEITLTLPSQIGEGNGVLPGAGTVTISGLLSADLNVLLESSDLAQLTTPMTVVIPKGQTNATFNVTAVDDAEIDGARVVTVTANAPGFAGATAQVTVLDDETPPVPAGPRPLHLSTTNSPNSDLSWAPGRGELIVNGDFETGDLRGWTQTATGDGEFIINDGGVDPFGPDAALPPFAGAFSIVSQQTGPGSNAIFQDVTLPAGVTSAILSWHDRIRNHTSLFAEPDQSFRVEIRSQQDELLATAFSTHPGDPLMSDWTARSFDLTQLAGRTVRIAFVEEDNFSYLNVHLDNISVRLNHPGELAYDVYFGTNPNPGAAEFLGQTAQPTWQLPRLALNTTYYWKIVSRQGPAASEGPVWQFSVPDVGPLDHFLWKPIASPQFAGQPFPVTVTAQDRFDNTVASFEDQVTLSAEEASPDQIAGSGTGNWEFPTGGFLPNARTQVLYPAGEVGPARRITALALYVENKRRLPLNRFTIRMKHSSLVSYPPTPAWERSGWTTVYQKNPLIDQRGWITFELSTPFDYDGVSSLMVDFSYRDSDFDFGGDCRFTEVAAATALAYQSFNFEGDPLAWSGTNSPPPEVSQNRPNLRFSSRNSIFLSPILSGSFTGGVWTGHITIAESAAQVILQAGHAENITGRANPIEVAYRNDIAVRIDQDPNPVSAGQTIHYTVLVSNSGPTPAEGVVVTNLIPNLMLLVSSNSSQGTLTTSGRTVVCNLGRLPAASQATIDLVVKATQPSGLATNEARVYRNGPDTYEGNNIALAVTRILPRPSLLVSDLTVVEGNTGITFAAFTARLSGPSSQPVTVHYATRADTATAVEDYLSTNGVLRFEPGTTIAQILVPIVGDTLDEFDEQFYLDLSNPANASLEATFAVAQILDDDGPSATVEDVLVIEGNQGSTNALFRVHLSGSSIQEISISYATAGGSAKSGVDFAETRGVAVFPPGTTSQTISIPVHGDLNIETSERFFLNLYDPINATLARAQAVATIVNDDGLPGDLDHLEWGPIASPKVVNQPFPVTVFAKDALNQPAVHFTGAVKMSAQLDLPDLFIGSGTEPWTTPLGTSYEDTRVQSIYLASEIGGARLITGLALNLTVVPGLPLNNWTIRMKHTTLSAYGDSPTWETSGWTTVLRGTQTLIQTGWVSFQFTQPFYYNGTSQLLVDYSFNNSEYTFREGACLATRGTTFRSIYGQSDSFDGDPITWSGMTPYPFPEHLVLNVQLLSAVPVSLSPTNSAGFQNGQWTGDLTVRDLVAGVILQADDGQGHRARSGRFDMNAVDDLSIAVVDTPDPVIIGLPLTYSISIHNSGPAPSTGVILSNRLPTTVRFAALLPSQGSCDVTNGVVLCQLGDLPGNQTATVTLIVNSPTQATTLSNRLAVYRNEADTYLSNNTAIVQTRVHNRPTISISDVEVMEGNSGTTNAIFEVRLTNPSSETVLVDFHTQNLTARAGLDYVATNGTLLFPPGVTNLPIAISILSDTEDEKAETFYVVLTNPIHATFVDAYGLGRIVDDDGPVISASNASVLEGDTRSTNAVFQLVLSAPSLEEIRLDYTTSDITAHAGEDYLEASGQVIFPVGSITQRVTIAVRGDVVIEPNETFLVNFFNVTNATLAKAQATGTIVNDDGLPGEIDHFEWDSIASPQYANRPLAVRVRARDSNNQTAIHFNETADLQAGIALPDLQAGDGEVPWEFPMETDYGASRLQSIYLAPEVGRARRLTDLALYVSKVPPGPLSRWTIRLQHTVLSQYGLTPTWEGSWTTVFQADQRIDDAGWINFHFSRPFDFNGTRNLLVDLSLENADPTFASGKCFSTYTTEARSIGAISFQGSDGAPVDWTGSVPEPAVFFQIPNLRFSGFLPVQIQPAKTTAFDHGVWIGAVRSLSAATNVSLTATDARGHTGTGSIFTVIPWVDTDGDGTPDEWERNNHLDPLNRADGALDSDGDGASNASEFAAGTDPQLASNTLRVQLRWTGYQMAISFPSAPGHVYRLERTDSLRRPAWFQVGSLIFGEGETVELSDPSPSPGSRFYRVVLAY